MFLYPLFIESGSTRANKPTNEQMKYFYDSGLPINTADVTNPFVKYYHTMSLNDYIILIMSMFEEKCIDIDEKMKKIEEGNFWIYTSYMKPKYAKRRRVIYSRLNELEDLRKTIVRTQQIQQSQINKLQKENYNIRSVIKSTGMKSDSIKTLENVVLAQNMHAIVNAKRSSKEITRLLISKNIDPVKEKLEEALEDFVLFSEMIKGKYIALVKRGALVNRCM